MMGFEPMTPCLQGRCSPNWATPPLTGLCFFSFFRIGERFYPFPALCWHWAIVPGRFQPSIFATAELNFCVRNGYRWTLCVCNTNFFSNPLITEYWTTLLLRTVLRLKSFWTYVMSPFGSLHVLHRKEVIQPHLPIRLPCYDLTPIIEPTFDCCLLAVSPQASGVFNFHGLTGGVYKARERIHRDMLIRDY